MKQYLTYYSQWKFSNEKLSDNIFHQLWLFLLLRYTNIGIAHPTTSNQQSRYFPLGVYTGYSAMSIAMILPSDGVVVACDVVEEIVNVGKPFWKAVIVGIYY